AEARRLLARPEAPALDSIPDATPRNLDLHGDGLEARRAQRRDALVGLGDIAVGADLDGEVSAPFDTGLLLRGGDRLGLPGPRLRAAPFDGSGLDRLGCRIDGGSQRRGCLNGRPVRRLGLRPAAR